MAVFAELGSICLGLEAMVDPKGHQASSPWQMPSGAWKDIGLRAYKRVWDDNVGLVAAGVAFYGFFALLSLLGLIVLAYGLAADPFTVIEHVRALTAVLPTDVAFIIGDQLMTAVRASQKDQRPRDRCRLPGRDLWRHQWRSVGADRAQHRLRGEGEAQSAAVSISLAIPMTFGALLIALVALAGTAALAFLQHLLPEASRAIVIVGKLPAICC